MILSRFNFGIVLACLVGLAAIAGQVAAKGAHAEDDIDVSKEPAAAVLEVGDKAPFMGVLMPPGRAAKLGTKLESCTYKLTLDEKLFDDELKIRTQALQAALDLEKQAGERQRLVLQKQLDAANERAWWDSAPFLLAVGVVSGIGTTIGAVYLLGQLRPVIPPA